MRQAGKRKDIAWKLAEKLSDAWVDYALGFGIPPQGTQRQLAALIELAGGETMLIRLTRKEPRK